MTQEQRERLLAQYAICRRDPVLIGDSWGVVDLEEASGEAAIVDELQVRAMPDDELFSFMKEHAAYEPDISYEDDDGDLMNNSKLCLIVREIEEGGEKE